MEQPDYYHEIAVKGRDIADKYEEQAAEAVRGDDRATEREVVNDIKTKAEKSAHSAFTDCLGHLWQSATLDKPEAREMADIIVSSNGRFVEVNGDSDRPKAMLRDAAAATIEHDIEKAAFDIINKRLADAGLDTRR